MINKNEENKVKKKLIVVNSKSYLQSMKTESTLRRLKLAKML